MRKLGDHRIRAGQALAAAALALAAAAGPATAVPRRLETVAVDGQTALGSTDPYLDVLPVGALNDRGDVSFVASIDDGSPPTGAVIVRFAGGGFERVLSTDPAPPELGGSYLSLGYPTLDDAGNFVFFAAGSPYGWVRQQGSGPPEALLRVGDPVPGLPGATWDENPSEDSLNGVGQLLLGTPIETAAGRSRGVFVVDDGGVDIVAVNGDPSPLPGGAPYTLVGPEASMNDAADVAFYAKTDVSPGRRGIFARMGGVPKAIALEGLPAPVVPARDFEFRSRPWPDVDASGRIVFDAGLGPCCSAPDQGLFLYEGGSVTPLAIAGDPVPDAPERAFVFLVQVRINDGGTVAFMGGSVDASEQLVQGVYVIENGAMSVVAESGDTVPGTGGGVIEDLSYQRFALNNRGDIAFFSVLADGRFAILLSSIEGAPVPALLPAAGAALALGLAALGAVFLRR